MAVLIPLAKKHQFFTDLRNQNGVGHCGPGDARR